MRKKLMREPPRVGPEGTIWFGGPVDRFSITLRISGDEINPDEISRLLGCEPSQSWRKGVPVQRNGKNWVPPSGRWSLNIKSKDLDEDVDLDESIEMLLSRLTSDRDAWRYVTETFRTDVFCGLFLERANRGFSLSVGVSKLLSERFLKIGFDIYFDPPE